MEFVQDLQQDHACFLNKKYSRFILPTVYLLIIVLLSRAHQNEESVEAVVPCTLFTVYLHA